MTKQGSGAMTSGGGPPLAVHTKSASPHEVSRVADTLLKSFVDKFTGRRQGDSDRERSTIYGTRRAQSSMTVLQL